MNRSESLKELTAAMVKVQSVLRPAVKDSQNSHLKNRYADLASVWDACREPLSANGLAVLQPASAAGHAVTVETTLLHASGEWVSEALTIEARDASPQSIGSAITYGRRYGLAALVGICPDDDDGEAAQPRGGDLPAAEHRQQQQPRPPQWGNGHQGQDRGQAAAPRQHDGPPRSGKALFAWTKDQEQKHEVGLLKYLNSWAKLQDFPGRMVDWSADQVELAHAEAVRKISGLGDGDAPEEAHRERVPGEEG